MAHIKTPGNVVLNDAYITRFISRMNLDKPDEDIQ